MNWLVLIVLSVSCMIPLSARNHKKNKGRPVSQKIRKQPRPPLIFQGFFPEYEHNRLDLIAQLIPASPVIFEAGGHRGEDTIKFAARWPDAQILSFEPYPPSFEKLSQITQDLKNVKAYQLAVNDYKGTAVFYVVQDVKRDGASSLLQPSAETVELYVGPKIEVPCVILDDWCRDNAVDHIDFMWLDLEGVELQILKSSPTILATVKVIYTETNFFGYRIGTTQFDDLKTFIEASGFKLLSHWYRQGRQGDAIFVKKEIFDEIVREYKIVKSST